MFVGWKRKERKVRQRKRKRKERKVGLRKKKKNCREREREVGGNDGDDGSARRAYH